jgi:uncharacterized protein involved in outer membrane biogenesis
MMIRPRALQECIVKKLLVGVIALIALLIAALLLGPSFINWNDHKAEIIAAVRDATGRELAIDGDISLRILPAPALSVRDIRLAGLPGSEAADMLTLKALDVRVALAPLISGQIQVTSVRLIQPLLVLETLPDGQANWHFEGAGGSGAGAVDGGGQSGPALSLDKLAVEDAVLIYRDRRAEIEERIEAISLDGSAASLQGPFHFTGKATARDLPLGFDVSIDTLAEGKPVGIRLSLKLAGDTAEASFSGRLEALETEPRLSGQLNLSAPDAAALQAAVLEGEAPSPVMRQPLQVKASVEASAKEATLNGIDLTFGPMQANGAISASLGEEPSYDLALAIGRLDLDRLLQGMAEASPSGQNSSAPGSTTTAQLPEIPANLQGSVVITIEGLKYRNGVVSQVQLDASADNGILRLERLSALLPGGSDLRLSGQTGQRDGAPRFDGQIELASNNLRGLLTWLDANPAAIPAGRLANMSLTSEFGINQQQAQIGNMNLRLDGTTIEGAATILLQARPSFGLALNIDRVNLNGYLPNGAEQAASQPQGTASGKAGEKAGNGAASGPLAVLEKFDSNLILNVGEMTYNTVPIRGLSAELGLAGGKLTVRRAAVRDLAGANFSLSGTGQEFAGKPLGKAKIRLRAKYFDGLARLAGLELPVPPKRLKSLTLDGEINGNAERLNFDIKATLAGLSGKASGSATGLVGPIAADLKLELRHGSLASLSRTFDLGIKPLPRADTPVSLQGSVKGGKEAMNLDLTAQMAGGQVKLNGSAKTLDKTPQIEVTANAAHKDLVGLLASLGSQYPPDQKSPGGLTLAANIKGGGDAFEFNGLSGKIGLMNLGGNAGVRLDGPRPMVTANLQAGDVVLDHFLGAGGQAKAGNAGGKQGRNQDRRRRGEERWSRDAIDLDALQAVDADIKLAAKRLVFQRYPFVEPSLHMTVKGGVMQVKELTGRLFKGKVGLRANLSSRPLPALGLSLQLHGADINQAMRTALEMDQVTGTLDFTGEFQTTGSSQWDLVNALAGQAKIHAENGSIRGFDMKSFSERLGRLNKAPDFLNLAQRAFSGGVTKYQSVDGNWNINNGVARTQDMLANLDASQATLKGAINLPTWQMDLRAVMRLTEHRNAPDMGAHLYGPLDRPRHNLKTAKLERWLLARLGRELLGKKAKSGGIGKLLDAVTGGGKTAQPSTPQPSQPGQDQPQQPMDPKQKLLEGLFKALNKKK